MFTGYQIIGLFATGSNGLDMHDVNSVMRDPRPAAITTAWNSIYTDLWIFLYQTYTHSHFCDWTRNYLTSQLCNVVQSKYFV